MLHDLTTQLKDALANEEWSLTEIELLTASEAKELLSKLGIECSLDELQNAITSAKREANKLTKSVARQQQVSQSLQQFGRSSVAIALRRSEKKLSNHEYTSLQNFVLETMDIIEAAFKWFFRKSEGGPLPYTVLTEVEQRFPIRSFIGLIDAFVVAAKFDSALDLVNRLRMLKLVNAKYGSHLKKQIALIDTGKKLKERLAREPEEFVSQIEFGRAVLPEKIDAEFLDRDSLFRSWLREFASEGLIEQIKIGGRFQFRSVGLDLHKLKLQSSAKIEKSIVQHAPNK